MIEKDSPSGMLSRQAANKLYNVPEVISRFLLNNKEVEFLLSVAQITEDNFCLRQDDRVPAFSFFLANSSLDGLMIDGRWGCTGLPTPSRIHTYK